MRDFKNEQIIFYCNCLGELHRGGKEDLNSVEELPLPLQSVYETLWSDSLSSHCYIAYVDERPGLLLLAEYDDDFCREESIPEDFDGKYSAMRLRGERMEKLIKLVNENAEVGIGTDTGLDLELGLFIPTENTPSLDVLRLYFLMEECAYSMPPDKVNWENDKLRALAERCLPPCDLRSELMEQLK